ncbi:MAG TPA: hypothetical protein VFP35_00325, partial [Candidatus Saccharimonadales bacterium]|nr:hypothetical protein [Candidatus Saccharimonadales bacterium]
MAKIKKHCVVCNTLFVGRVDAKTCSSRCRKRLQRTKSLLSREVGAIKQSAESAAKEIENLIEPKYADDEGFIGEGALPPSASLPTISKSSPKPNSANTETAPFSPPKPPPPYDPKNLAPINPIAGESKPQEPKFSFYTEEPPKKPIFAAPKPISLEGDEPLESPKTVVIQVPQTSALNLSNSKMIRFAGAVLGVLVIVGASVFFLTNKPVSTNLASSTAPTSAQLLANKNTQTIHFNRTTYIDNGKSLTATGQVLIQNETNSSSALDVQNASGSSLFTVNTTNSNVGIGSRPTAGGAQLQVAGNISSKGSVLASGGTTSISSQGLVINSVLVCTSTGCKATTPPTDFSQFATLGGTQQFNGANNFTNSSNSFSGNGTNLTNLNAASLSSGTVSDNRLSTNVALKDQANVFTNTNSIQVTDSNAFSVQNAGGSQILAVDTAGAQVTLGMSGPSGANGKLVFNNAVNSSSISLVSGATSASYNLTLPTIAPGTGQCLQTDSITASQLVFGNCSGGGSGVTNVGAIDSQTKSANGAVISGANLFLQTADGTYPGLVGTGAQTFAGSKTFSAGATFNGNVLAKTTSASTTAFQVQNAANAVFTVDTSGNKVVLGTASALDGQLQLQSASGSGSISLK